MKRLLFLTAILACTAVRAAYPQGQEFDFSVRHRHVFKDCSGTLKITGDGVEYRTDYAQDARKWRFEEIRTLEIKSPTKISIITYEDQKRYAGKDRVFEFTLLDKKATPELSAFLLSRVKRPTRLAVTPVQENPVYEISVKHLHVFGGALGVLRIYPDKVIFQSKETGDSRVWRIKDIESFGHPDRYRFQITGYLPKTGGPTEVYNFQLMDDLPEGVYDYLWVRLYPSSYYPMTQR